jgi:hypothetical protein
MGDAQSPGIPRITAAAISFPSGTVISVEPPLRHHDCFRAARERGILFGEMHDGEQGFVTSDGRFVDRKQALVIAQAAGQIRRKTPPDYLLFSEDVW